MRRGRFLQGAGVSPGTRDSQGPATLRDPGLPGTRDSQGPGTLRDRNAREKARAEESKVTTRGLGPGSCGFTAILLEEVLLGIVLLGS